MHKVWFYVTVYSPHDIKITDPTLCALGLWWQ